MPTNAKHSAKKTQKKTLPPPGPRKRNPRQLEKILDNAIEDSMAASDPLSTVMPEVKKGPEEHNNS